MATFHFFHYRHERTSVNDGKVVWILLSPDFIMKVHSKVLQHLHLDKTYSLLNARNINILLEFFKAFDMGKGGLNDIQFYQFMNVVTDMSQLQVYRAFDMLDTDASGEIEFDEFCLLVCILIANQDGEGKQFIFHHSRTVFDLLDEDGSNTVSAEEFEIFGFLFSFQLDSVKRIFNDFDVSGDQELDYKEFRMFAMACIDKDKELREERRLEKLQPPKSFSGRMLRRLRQFLGRDRAAEQNVTLMKAKSDVRR